MTSAPPLLRGAAHSAALAPSVTATRRLRLVGRVFYSLGFVGLGITHFVFGDFMSGRAPAWPEGMPGRTLWAYLSGTLFILASIAIIARRHARAAALAAGTIIAAWALLRLLPEVATDTLLAPSWTRGGKALTFFGGFFALAGMSAYEKGAGRGAFGAFVNLSDPFVTLGRVCLAMFLVITGIQHFMYTEFVASLIPGWFPGDAVLWTLFAGIALISGGVGLLIPYMAALAALLSGLMIFSWFWIVHLPRSLGGVSDRVAVFEALAVSGLALLLAGWLGERSQADP